MQAAEDGLGEEGPAHPTSRPARSERGGLPDSCDLVG